MHTFELQQKELVAMIRTALECSIYLAPTEPGLSHEEIIEVGKRLDYQTGEIDDALQSSAVSLLQGSRRLLQDEHGMWSEFNLFERNPDYRNVDAFDFVVGELRSRAREVGARNACMDRKTLVARAKAKRLPERDVEAAITILIIPQRLRQEGGIVSFVVGREKWPTASEQLGPARSSRHFHETARDELRARVYEVVKDVVARRADGRPSSAEPLDSFAEAMDGLGYGHFQLWWRQMVAELRHADANLSPVSVSVLSAALVEGALALVVKHARQLGLGVLGSKDFDEDPRRWKIDNLVASAAAGGKSAILDEPSRVRAVALVRTRQRIHAGRMVSEFPGGVPDLRPEEAREAAQTAESVVRRVLDWLERHPKTQAALPES